MGKLKRISFALLFLVLTWFVFYVQVGDTSDNKGKEYPTLILIPLDDRPANIYLPKQVGKTAGIRVITPPKDIIGSYKTPGDSEKIVDWLIRNADKGDGFVLSSSMLAYGGLIASRTDDRTIEEALVNIEVIKKLKEKYPNKPIYVYDTIQRLAVTAVNEDYKRYYDQVREWAILYDKVMNFGDETGKDRLEELESLIPENVLEEYLEARERNHAVNKKLIDWVANDYIDFLILAQDDAAQYGLHRSEREELVNKVTALDIEQEVTIFPGTDEVDVVLVARFATKVYQQSPTFYVRYSGIHGKDWIAPFEDIQLEQNVTKHITASGAQITTNESLADINLVLNTPSESNEFRARDLTNSVEEIDELISNNEHVAIGDVLIVNKADSEFVSLLTKKVDITNLLSYSGWNTAGNTLGIVIGHATAREVFLNQESSVSKLEHKEAATSHYEFLLHRFVKDVGYKNTVMPRAEQYIDDIGANAWELGEDYEIVNQFVEKELKLETIKWLEHFKGKELYGGSIEGKDMFYTIKELYDVHVKLPWPRIFEVELEPSLILEEKLNQDE